MSINDIWTIEDALHAEEEIEWAIYYFNGDSRSPYKNDKWRLVVKKALFFIKEYFPDRYDDLVNVVKYCEVPELQALVSE